jgi:hypothetical protein
LIIDNYFIFYNSTSTRYSYHIYTSFYKSKSAAAFAFFFFLAPFFLKIDAFLATFALNTGAAGGAATCTEATGIEGCEGATGGAFVGILFGGGPPPTGIIRPLSMRGIIVKISAGICLLLLSAPVLGPNERVNAIGARFDPVVLCLPVYAPSVVAAAPLLVPLPLPP